VTLMLPQDKPEEALAVIAALDAKNGLLSKDIVSVDLRLGDRMFVRLTPEAAERRTVEIKEREKLAKRKGAST
jgi:cell division protein FtsQ